MYVCMCEGNELILSGETVVSLLSNSDDFIWCKAGNKGIISIIVIKVFVYS